MKVNYVEIAILKQGADMYHMPMLLQIIYCIFVVAVVTFGMLIGCFTFFCAMGFIGIDLQNYMMKRKVK